MIVSPVASRAFVGRDAELAMLHERRRALAQRRGSTVLIGGPPGIGKSRLLSEFCATIDGGRAPLLIRTECAEFGGVTFGPVRDIIDALGSVDGRIDDIARRSIEQSTFFHGLDRVVRDAAAKRSIVACVEDIHWADPATLEFLIALASRVGSERVLVVATYRSDAVAAEPALRDPFGRLFRAPSAYRIALEPLSEHSMFALIDSAAEGRPAIERHIRSTIARRAEGNPLHAEELLKSVLETGDPSGVPLSIGATILARFATLDERDRVLLRHAAILGYRFDPQLLGELLELDPATIATSLRNALANNLIVEEPQRGAELRFRHALVHDAISYDMLEFEARTLHARVACLLEERGSPRIAEIAYHWWKARDRARAASTNEAAAEAAFGLHAYRDAATFFRRALEFANDDAAKFRLKVRLASSLSSTGDHAHAARLLAGVVDVAIAAGDYDAATLYACGVASRLTYAGDDARGRAYIDTFAAEHAGRLSLPYARLVAGAPIWLDPGGGDAAAWIRRFALKADDEDPSPDTTRMQRWMGLVASAAVGDADGWARFAASLTSLSEKGDARLATLTLGAIADTAVRMGLPHAVASARNAALHASCERYSLEKARAKAYLNDAYDAYLRGELARARVAVLAAHALGDSASEGGLLALAPLIGFDLDDPTLTSLGDDAQLSGKLEGERAFHQAGLRAAGLAARLRAHGDLDAMRTMLERCVRSLQTLYGAQFALPFAARFLRSADARAHILALLAAADPRDPSARATAAMVEALFAARDRASDRTERALAAADAYRANGWPLLEAHALELAGTLDGARELFERCGATRDLRRLSNEPAPVALEEVGTSNDEVMLTRRERDVAAGVAEGLGNAELATRLGLSVKTIESHLSRIYARLGFRSRAQLAAFVASRANREA